MHDALREAVRRQAGKSVAPIVAIIDSRSVKTAKVERDFEHNAKFSETNIKMEGLEC